MNRLRMTILACVLTLPAAWSYAQGQYIDIFPKSIDEIEVVLDTLDSNLDQLPTDEYEPIMMMLHGPEAARFLRSNYKENQSIIDKTAKLSGYGVLEVRICDTWMRKNKYSHEELFNFVTPVPFGAAELRRLEREEGYSEYTFDL